jgi:hypothetical protein
MKEGIAKENGKLFFAAPLGRVRSKRKIKFQVYP